MRLLDNCPAHTSVDGLLSRLANRYGVTKREMLERLINEADQQIEDTLKTDEEWETYHNVTQ